MYDLKFLSLIIAIVSGVGLILFVVKAIKACDFLEPASKFFIFTVISIMLLVICMSSLLLLLMNIHTA